MITRNRTPSKYVYYGLHLYFSGLSLRKASERLSQLYTRNHVSIWNWIQKYNPQKISSKRKRISEFIVDETLLKVGSEYIWLWIAIEPENKQILALTISKERNMLLLKGFCQDWSKIMEGIRCQLMEVIGILRLVGFKTRSPHPLFLGEKPN